MRTEHKIIGFSIIFGLFVWVLDAIVDHFLFHERPFFENLIFDVPIHDIYMRSVIIAVFIVFGLITSRIFVERKKAEKALRENEKKYRDLVETSQDLIWTCDIEGRYIYLNPAWVQTLGYKYEEMIGHRFTEFQKADVAERDIKEFGHHLLEGSTVTGYETTQITKSGNEIHLIYNAIPLTDSTGKIIGTHGTAYDITEHKKAEKALERYSHDLEQSNKLKDLFIDIMRHDLLNPATVVKGMATLAFRGEKNPEKKERFQNIVEAGDLIIDMVVNASILAKLESGEKLEFKEDNLGIILRKAVEGNAHLADEKKTQLTLHVDGEFNAVVNPLVYDVFSNLINNAIKYGPENSEVVVKIEGVASDWKISVSDRGDGIPDEYKKTIFDRFERVHKGGVKGSGLGLAIVKKVVEAHKGRVWMEDNPDGGSVFFVTLPKS
ncbi:MAG: PAS domain-containing sensor histidine kinase [Thermoplasmata archaeon]